MDYFIHVLIHFQIRRSVRKKHTLPNYKIRYRPFFIKPEPRPPPQDVFMGDAKLSNGALTVKQCTISFLFESTPFVLFHNYVPYL